MEKSDNENSNSLTALYQLPIESSRDDIAGLIINGGEVSENEVVVAGKAFSADYDDKLYLFHPLMVPSKSGVIVAGQPITDKILSDVNCTYQLYFTTLYAVVNVFLSNRRKRIDLPMRMTLSDLIRKVCRDDQVNVRDIRFRRFFFSVVRSLMFTEVFQYLHGRNGELIDLQYGNALSVLVSVGNQSNYRELAADENIDCNKELYFHVRDIFPGLLDPSKLIYFAERSGDFFTKVTGSTEAKIGCVRWDRYVESRIQEAVRYGVPIIESNVSPDTLALFDGRPFTILTIRVDTIANLAGAKNRTDVMRLRKNFLNKVKDLSVVKKVAERLDGNRIYAYDLYVAIKP